MKKFFDIKNWRWWQITIAYVICMPLWNFCLNWEFDFEKISPLLLSGAFLGLIIGGLVEFVRRDKAKTERQQRDKVTQDGDGKI